MALLTLADPTPNSTILWIATKPKLTTIDLVGGILCHICQNTLANKKDFDTHYALHNTDSKEIIYTCIVCQKQIAGYPSFRGHCYTMHVVKEKFKCEYCLKTFSKSTSLKEHVNVMHKFKCSVCNKEFSSKKELQLHKIIHDNTHNAPPFDCQSCKSKIETVAKCKEHILKHASDIYSCPICNENIPNKEKANDHLKTHFNANETVDSENNKEEISIEKGREAAISCLFCSTDYKNRVEFDAHFSLTHGEEDIVYTCVECGEQFEKYSKFSSHTYDHYVKNRYQCDLCSKAFCRLSLLVSHMSACQGDPDATGTPFVCAHCNFRYSSALSLRRHMREIHDMLQLVCPEEGCKLTFSKPEQLIFHQKSHHSTSKNWCGQCGLYFTSLHACERHLDIHKKKLYLCPVCNRHYSDKNLIMSHVFQHFEAILHLCKVCGKVFNARNRLVEHTKTHLEIKCHKCQYCKKSFVKIGQLQQHLNVHTGAKPYKCPVCEKAFTSYPNWSKHISRMHNIDRKSCKNILKKSDNVVLTDNNGQKQIDKKKNIKKKEIKSIVNKKIDDINTNVDETLKVTNENEDYTIFESNENSKKSNIVNMKNSNDVDKTVNVTEVEMFENVINDTGSKLYKCSVCDKSFTCYSLWNKHMCTMQNTDCQNNKTIIVNYNIEEFAMENQATDINKNIKSDIYNALNKKSSNLILNVDASDKISNENIDPYIYYDFEGNVINSNSIDHTIIEKEVETFESVLNDKTGDKFGEVLPQNKNNTVTDIPRFSSDISQPLQTVSFPPEYGPEFNTGLETNWGSFIDLDDHNLPHIDPLLTIKIEEHNKMYVDPQNYYEPTSIGYNNYGNAQKWEPPIITKVHHDYTYGYGDIAEANRLTVLNSDNFEVFT